MTDIINHPSHYTQAGATLTLEPIDLCEQCGFLLGNALKYLFRYEYKGQPLEDLRKAEFYLKRYLSVENDLRVDFRVPDETGIIFKAFRDRWFLREWDTEATGRTNVQAILALTQDKIKELEHV